MDETILAVDHAVRGTGTSGFETQTLVWLDGRVDVPALQAGLDALRRKYPLITSHLQPAGLFRRPAWRFRPDAQCTLQERQLETTTEEEVLGVASELLSEPRDLTAEPPIRFHLLHGNDGRDVLLMQYNHTLMDNPAAIPLLRRLDQLARGESDASQPDNAEDCDRIAEYLSSYSRLKRLTAMLRVIHMRTRSIRGISLFGRDEVLEGDSRRQCITANSLDADAAREISSSVAAACRFPALSMALLASVFRTGRQLGFSTEPQCRITTGIGLELGLRDDNGPLFQNLSSVVPLAARSTELDDREQLTRALNAQLRERLARHYDLGLVELGSAFRNIRRLVRYVTKRLMRTGYSVWYAYFGSTDGLGETFLGVPIRELRFTGPCWPSVGLTVIVNQYRGRLNLQITYLPACISHTDANAFMNALLEDLQAWR
jgi:hypothetical protein